MNYLWGLMILTGIFWGAANGNLDAVTKGLIDSSKESVELGLVMLGIMSFWCGILEVGNRAGLVDWLTKKAGPMMDFLYPGLPKDHPARQPMAVNMIANILGLGMAATPAGLAALKALQQNRDEEKDRQTATNTMCTFLIINISSLQLVPINMIAYRSQFGSSNPMAIVGPALIATFCSTLAAVIFCKIMDMKSRRGKAVPKK